jgi:hypothetical protein
VLFKPAARDTVLRKGAKAKTKNFTATCGERLIAKGVRSKTAPIGAVFYLLLFI